MHLWHWLTGLSLIHGPLHAALAVGTTLGLGVLLSLGHGRAWWTGRVLAAVAVACAALAACWLLVEVAKPWPDGLPDSVLAWIGAGLLAVALVLLAGRRRRWWVRVVAVAAAATVVLGAADGVDAVYGSFPTVATALQLPPYDQVAASTVVSTGTPGTQGTPVPSRQPLWQTWHPPADLPSHGAVTEVTIPGTRSGFAARPAWVYVPPAYLTAQPPPVPVLVMIGGQPGGTRDWLDGGQLAQRMDEWAAAHGGLAPVVVMPDALGAETANPLCMDSALGRVDTYLSQDVPAWVTSTLHVDPDHTHWAVGGFSYGGTCALQLAVAHPDLFPSFFDTSGQQSPTLGDHQRTVAATFHGDEAAFAAVDPLSELADHRYPRSAAYLVVGAQDADYRDQQRAVAAAVQAAGMSVTGTEVPGGHSWAVWRPALLAAIPWLASRMGLTP
jgi:enterochelin esterase-like enzyme